MPFLFGSQHSTKGNGNRSANDYLLPSDPQTASVLDCSSVELLGDNSRIDGGV